MDRIEIEAKLNKDRAWLLETYAAMPAEDLRRGATPSAHDPKVLWSPLDHLVHLTGIERDFNAMIRRHFEGVANPVGLMTNDDGSRRTLDEIMKVVHGLNERLVEEHRAKSLAQVVALGQAARAETLALLAALTDAQLQEKLPNAPWADGTVGGVISTNAGHGRQHYQWLKEGLAQAAGSQASA
jgi:hypothetical protein